MQEKIEMAKRKELLEKHPYKISQGKDGNWRTYLPDKNQVISNGVYGIRTRDLNNANVARSQLR